MGDDWRWWQLDRTKVKTYQTLAHPRGNMTEEERAEWHRKQDEKVERSKKKLVQDKGDVWDGPTESEKLHEAFYRVLNDSREVLTPEQEDDASKFSQWLDFVEFPEDITGV